MREAKSWHVTPTATWRPGTPNLPGQANLLLSRILCAFCSRCQIQMCPISNPSIFPARFSKDTSWSHGPALCSSLPSGEKKSLEAELFLPIFDVREEFWWMLLRCFCYKWSSHIPQPAASVLGMWDSLLPGHVHWGDTTTHGPQGNEYLCPLHAVPMVWARQVWAECCLSSSALYVPAATAESRETSACSTAAVSVCSEVHLTYPIAWDMLSSTASC